MNEEYAEYPALFQPNKEVNSKLMIKRVSKGTIQDYNVDIPGDGYKVGSRVSFKPQEGARDAKAKVSEIEGKKVNSISVASTAISGLEVIPSLSAGNYVAYAEEPHDLTNLG